VTRPRMVPALVAALLTWVAPGRAQPADEPPPRLTASAVLDPAVRQGPHHRVDEDIATEGYFHRFGVTSTFGPFEAIGRSQLAVRLHEIQALAALQDVSKTEVFLAAAGQSVVRIGQSAAAVVTDPVASAKNLGDGIKRFGVNLGRRTQRAVASASDDGAPAPAGGGAAGSILGVTSAARRWAQKVGVDPYTTNPVLRQALTDIAKVDAAGSIATKVVVPVPQLVGMTSTVGGLVWGSDPEEVRKVNEQRLRELSVPKPAVAALSANSWFTLTYQTRLIAALHAVAVAGVADYVQSAAGASSEREALFFVESAEMLQQRHGKRPVTGVLADSRAMVAAGGDAIEILLPLDWIGMTAATQSALQDIGRRAPGELGPGRLVIVTTGRVSTRAQREIASAGWVISSPATTR